MTSLTLIRGISGSGKSTMAKALLDNGEVDCHFEADQWLYHTDGRYEFTRERVIAAHQQCKIATELAIEKGLRVVVSNTFARHWEMQPYKDMAEHLNCSLSVIVAKGQYKSLHAPDFVVAHQKSVWEK